MTKNNMYMITIGLLWFAFGYAVQGLDAAAVLFASGAAVLALGMNRTPAWKEHIRKACLPVFVTLILFHISGLNELFPALAAVASANILANIWFLENGTDDLKQGIRFVEITAAVMIFLALAVPANVIAEMVPDRQTAFLDLILLLSVIFLPELWPCAVSRLNPMVSRLFSRRHRTQE